MLSFNHLYTRTRLSHEYHSKITDELFGSNFLITSVQNNREITIEDGYGAAIKDVGIKNLRYPGGTVTEYNFNMLNPEAEESAFGGGRQLIPQRQFLEFAAEANTTVTLVIPTRQAFGPQNDAWTSLQNGSYGTRNVSSDYLNTVTEWVQYVLEEATRLGVKISAFEIGNEFWLSGEMTSREYGRVASATLEAATAGIESFLRRPEFELLERPDLVVQTMSNTGLMSPVAGHWVKRDSFGAVTPAREGEANSLWIAPQGSLRVQQDAIMDAIIRAGNANLVDGLVDHFYTRGTLESITSSHYIFWQFHHAEQRLGYESGDLKRYVTEWNTQRSQGSEINFGLAQASALVEMVYQMSIHNVEAANFWPLWFPTTNSTGMFDRNDFSLRLPAETFKLMQESLIDTRPILHSNTKINTFEMQSHGFLSAERFVLFTSNRGNEIDDTFRMSVSNVADENLQNGLSGRYFVVQTELYAELRSTQGSSDFVPVINWTDGNMSTGEFIYFDRASELELIRTEITFVHDDGVEIFGRGGNDRIVGGRGNDTIFGGEGNNELFGGEGNDIFVLGSGNNYVDGGDGFDATNFSATSSTFSIFFNWSDRSIEISNYGRSVNIIRNVEIINFTNKSIFIDFSRGRAGEISWINEGFRNFHLNPLLEQSNIIYAPRSYFSVAGGNIAFDREQNFNDLALDGMLSNFFSSNEKLHDLAVQCFNIKKT